MDRTQRYLGWRFDLPECMAGFDSNDGIFSPKQGDGISCELEVMRPFYGAEFRTTDLCRCLGILIDNAIEEVRGKEDARVHIMISSQNGITTFRVKNALYHEVDFHKIWQQGYSTKGSSRGIGLASYKKILSGYDNVLPVTAVREGCFIQELKIQERDADYIFTESYSN